MLRLFISKVTCSLQYCVHKTGEQVQVCCFDGPFWLLMHTEVVFALHLYGTWSPPITRRLLSQTDVHTHLVLHLKDANDDSRLFYSLSPEKWKPPNPHFASPDKRKKTSGTLFSHFIRKQKLTWDNFAVLMFREALKSFKNARSQVALVAVAE